ncbi:ankyrin repeat and IBR domain-containing protein 1 isoform X2 [Esox lucius]|uniref:Ankyrin repeat and IBR domain-containing protein 1 n=1 Tax=Esox lucius TaxID=8010 RepID=A0A3P8X9T6_ESOLU|nr:ankyrin repeat and IBR domain-containing protein 1 isoform X2 [Esox lucius]
MGNTATKFRKALVSGDEALAWQLYEGNSQFREGLDPNASYGETYQHNTPLHYTCRHAMTRLLRSFLFNKEGNPNKRNVQNETCLHVLCQGAHILLLPEGALSHRLARPQRDEQRRADCLQMILSWTGARLDRGQYERANVNAADNRNSTCLHYAAAAGLKSCVELLVQSGSDLFVEDEEKLTPCDHAERQQHTHLALRLEAMMVFSQHAQTDTHTPSSTLRRKEAYEGLKLQDLRRLKDMLIVETADMLQAPLFTAEALLRAHDWDREKLLEAWMSDSEGCCQRSGVLMPTPPPSGYNAWDTLPSPRTPRSPLTFTLTSPTDSCLTPGEEGLATCGICLCSISVFEDPIDVSCGHEFCRACWEGFLNVKIQEGEAHNIFCPAYDCYQLVPVQVIESVVSREMDKRYLQFDIKAFVENNPSIRWCPAVQCERAVRLTRPGPGVNDLGFPVLPSPAVDCGKGHLFCWECLGEAHEPCDCQTWRMWLQKVSEMKPEELAGVSEAYEDAANCLWLLTNSKPCANCKSPIQKNEGCNHMQCAKCKYDFCWICLEEWKKHSSSTGGYYRCTRYEVITQLEEQSKEMTGEAEKKHRSFQELDRFMHYYTRYKNHEHSYKLEQRLLKTAKEKMEQLSRAFIGCEGSPPDTRFIEDGVCELLKTRRVLKCSYPYGFFLQPHSTQKEIFELMQTDLEMAVEDLAQKVNRPYLRTPCHKIISAACLVQQKREEFLASVARGVAPNDSPEVPRRSFPAGSWDWEYLGFTSPEEYADFQNRRRHRPRRRGDMLSLHNLRSNSSTPETNQNAENTEVLQERVEGRRQPLRSLDEDDPNILLAIQLSLQDSRREREMEGGMGGGMGRSSGAFEGPGLGSGQGLDIGPVTGQRAGGLSSTQGPQSVGASLGASGSAPHPRPDPNLSLNAELLELGESLMRLGQITTPYTLDNANITTPYNLDHYNPVHSCTLGQDHNYAILELDHTAPYTYSYGRTGDSNQDHGIINIPFTPEHDHSCGPNPNRDHPDVDTAYSSVHCQPRPYTDTPPHPDLTGSSSSRQTGLYASDPQPMVSLPHHPDPDQAVSRTQITHPDPNQHQSCSSIVVPDLHSLNPLNLESLTADLDPATNPDRNSSATPQTHSHSSSDTLAPKNPTTGARSFLLSSPDPDLLSPVVPPGDPFSPNDPGCLEPLDATAGALLLDNIMAWIQHTHPQDSPQNIALIPSVSSETESPPEKDSATILPQNGTDRKRDCPPNSEASCSEAALAELQRAQGGEARGAHDSPGDSPEVKRPSTLDLECRGGEERVEYVDTGCGSDLSQDAVETRSHANCGDGNLTPAEVDPSSAPWLVDDQSSEEWDEQIHLV